MRRRSGAFLAFLVLATLVAASTARATAETETTRTVTPVTWLAFLPCPTPETGELIQLSGQLSVVTSVVRDGTGATHTASHWTLQNVSGVGLTTGTSYRFVQNIQFVANTDALGPPPWAISSVANWRIIGQGTAEDWSLSGLFHVTVTPDGQTSVSIDTSSSACQ